MHGERDGRTLSSPSPSMFTDESNKAESNPTSGSSSHNPSTELAYLPIGCAVSAKYRGAFCSAQVKAIEKQVKLKVTVVESNETITIQEEQIVQSAPLRIGNTVTIRLNSSNRRQSNDSNSHSHYSRSGLAAFIPSANPDEKQATIKQIIDNSLYTVVFNDGDEKSLRRSSLCVQGIRLYQNQFGQQKILDEIPSSSGTATTAATASSSTSPSPSLPASSETTNVNDIASIVAIQRQGSSDHPVFPALVLKRKALADYMWVRSFADGREYIVHTRDDVHPYQNNADIQALCRSTSREATQACEKFLKYNQIPAVWQRKKKKQSKNDDDHGTTDEENSSDNESSSDDDEEDDDEIDEETAEEKDSFVAQLFAFMDDRGTPINNIPKVQNYDLDLHRLFKIVRLFGGYNKVTKNDQWDKVHIKMGLPDETSSGNDQPVERAYKKYLFAYEDLSKKLGSMNAPSAYFGGRTSMGSDSRRSLIRVRQQQEEEKNAKKAAKTKVTPASVKQRGRKSLESRPSVDSKPTAPAPKKPPAKPATPANRKAPNKTKSANVLSSGSSESDSDSGSETSDDDSSSSSASNYDDNRKNKGKAPPASSAKKSPAVVTTPSSSSVSKKAPQISSTKTEPKKTGATSKPASSATNDSKQSKLTITIPIAKSKTSNTVQSVKKPPSSSTSSHEEKKKLSTSKPESKPIPGLSPKKPLSASSKTSQIIKTHPTNKHSSNEPSKLTSTSNKASTSTAPLPFKQKPTLPQSSASSNNKERSVSKSTSSSVDSRAGKPTKINSSSTKSISDDRSNSVPPKKLKPIIKEEVHSKPMSSPSTMKIPKLSSSNDPTKKPTNPVDKFSKKPPSKEGIVKASKIPESTATSKLIAANTDQPVKLHTASPTRPHVLDTVKKAPPRDPSPVPVTPKLPSPLPPPIVSSISPISDEGITPTNIPPPPPLPIINAPTLSSPYDDTPDLKPLDVPLVFQPVSSSSISLKEANEHGSPSSTSTKRPHSDENTEAAYISSTISDTDEQLSPLKRVRRSMSSQESIDTLSSSDQPPISDHLATHRNIPVMYEEIAVNDVLLVTWGSNGGKLYPARCCNKNDEKNELFVHYTGYNSRHDEWIKLDRVVERKESSNGQALIQPRPRRTSQMNTLRQQYTDSTNSSITGPNSNEPVHQQHLSTINPSIVDVTLLSTSVADDDQQQKTQSSLINRAGSIEKSKPMEIDESDLDDNSQENNRPWSQLETISSTEDDALSSTSTNRTSQSDLKLLTEAIMARRFSTATSNSTENILSTHQQHDFQAVEDSDQELGLIPERELPKSRQSRATSVTNKIDPTSSIKCELTESILSQASDLLKRTHHYPLHVKEETIDGSSLSHQVPIPLTLKLEPVPPSTNILSSPPATVTGNRRASARQLKRRTLREPNTGKDSSASMKKRTRFDNGNNTHGDSNADSGNNSDQTTTRSNSTEQQITDNSAAKRNRPTGRRGGKRSATQQEYENEDYRSTSPSYLTMRQQLKDMFKHRPSRYNFLDLNNNLAGDERIVHLKDRMRECQKVFFNLKSALVKVEKQRKVFLRKQKPLINVTTTVVQPASAEILTTSTCT